MTCRFRPVSMPFFHLLLIDALYAIFLLSRCRRDRNPIVQPDVRQCIIFHSSEAFGLSALWYYSNRPPLIPYLRDWRTYSSG